MKLLMWGLVITNIFLCSGCAVFNRNNTPALNFVEQHVLPRENPERMISYPLAIPVGLVAASLDMFLLHPATVVKDAWNDTGEMLWEKLDWNERYVTTAASLVPRAAVSPIVFTGDFLARSSFDVTRKGGDVHFNKSGDTSQVKQQKENREKLLAEARRAMDHHDYQAAFSMAEEILSKEPSNQQAAVIKANVYLEQRNLNSLAVLPPHLPLFIDDRYCRLFGEVLFNGSPAERMQALAILERNYFVLAANRAAQGATSMPHTYLMPALERNLADSDRAIRMKTIQVLGKYRNSDPLSRDLLEKLAKGDDPVLAAAAAALLR